MDILGGWENFREREILRVFTHPSPYIMTFLDSSVEHVAFMLAGKVKKVT